MDLKSGNPWWVLKNGLQQDYPKLNHSLTNQEIVIIGSGISGALTAHALCTAGFKCTIVDRRIASSGSTWANTGHINYELDSSMNSLLKRYPEEFCIDVFKACKDAVYSLQQVLADTGVDCAINPCPSLYIAADKKGLRDIEEECITRNNAGFTLELLNDSQLLLEYGIVAKGATRHYDSAQIDPYKAATGILDYHVKAGNLTIYTRTHIEKLEHENGKVILTTDDGLAIEAKHVVCAAGYEAGMFLPKEVMKLTSSYAFVSEPLDENLPWEGGLLIWDTSQPYFYLSNTNDNRLVIGGGDIKFKNEKLRDSLMDKKIKALLEQCKTYLPEVKVEPAFEWCGTFSETDDSLPYIGLHPALPNVYFALGYGGNGTMFSQLAAEIISNIIQGIPDHRQALFGFNR